MNAKNPLINFIFLEKSWENLTTLWKEEIGYALEKAVVILGQDFSKVEVSIVLANNETVQNLNKSYRHIDKPTNVLSFPSEAEGELGDIILAYETVLEEAKAQEISPLHHALHLIIHGFLHLLGYDHCDECDAVKMETLEIQILRSLNLHNPYEVL